MALYEENMGEKEKKGGLIKEMKKRVGKREGKRNGNRERGRGLRSRE